MKQQPGELNIVPVGSVIQWPGRAILRLRISPPFSIKQDRRQGFEVEGELYISRAVLGVQHPPDDQIYHFEEPAAMSGTARHLVERRQSFHHVHMYVQALAVAAARARPLGPPVPLHDLQEPTVSGIGHVLGHRRVRSLRGITTARITGRQEILAEGIDGETLSVANLARV